MPTQPSRLVLVLFLFALVPACGGSSESRPGPLAYHLDEMYIARIPLEEKQAILQAQNDHAAAKMARANAEAMYNESATDLEVARNERSQAELDEKSAESRKKAADESGDMNRINSASREVRVAKLSRQAADKKVAYMEARRAYLKQNLLQVEDAMYAQEARYELSKARLAQSKNIRPKGFDMANYETQSQERSRYAQRTAAELKREKDRAEALRREWQALVKEAERARSGSSSANTGSSAL